MIVYKDVFSGDTIFDAGHSSELVDDIAYCFVGKYEPVYASQEDGLVAVRTAVDIVEKYGLQVSISGEHKKIVATASPFAVCL